MITRAAWVIDHIQQDVIFLEFEPYNPNLYDESDGDYFDNHPEEKLWYNHDRQIMVSESEMFICEQDALEYYLGITMQEKKRILLLDQRLKTKLVNLIQDQEEKVS
jgi:hypothetical protein